MATTTWKNGKTAKACCAFPHVWAAIHGCTGRGTAWRYTVGHFGRRTVEHACEACKAARERLDALRGPALTAELERLQAAAGVADYRLAEVRVEKGRPVLTGRLDAYSAREALLDALTAWIDGYGPIARCVELIIAIDADCSGEVARVCSRAQRGELAAAYRAAKRSAA
jgi:hypothetical protein